MNVVPLRHSRMKWC